MYRGEQKNMGKEDIEKEIGVLITENEYQFLIKYHTGKNAMRKLQLIAQCRAHLLSEFQQGNTEIENGITGISNKLDEFLNKHEG
jgi:hypothetical protein